MSISYRINFNQKTAALACKHKHLTGMFWGVQYVFLQNSGLSLDCRFLKDPLVFSHLHGPTFHHQSQVGEIWSKQWNTTQNHTGWDYAGYDARVIQLKKKHVGGHFGRIKQFQTCKSIEVTPNDGLSKGIPPNPKHSGLAIINLLRIYGDFPQGSNHLRTVLEP